MRKNQAPKDNFKRQQKILLAVVGVIVILGLVAAGAAIVASSNQRVVPIGGEDEVAQLAQEMNAAFPLLQVIGAFDRDPVEVIYYEPSSGQTWTDTDRANMDKAILLAMQFAAERGKGLQLYLLAPTSLAGRDGKPANVFSVSGVFVCMNVEGMQDVNWNSANHDTITENCMLFPGGQYWGETEAILWPPEQSIR